MEILTRFAIKFVRSLRTCDLQTTAKVTLQIINKKSERLCSQLGEKGVHVQLLRNLCYNSLRQQVTHEKQALNDHKFVVNYLALFNLLLVLLQGESENTGIILR